MIGLAPIDCYIGTRDIVYPDVLELQRRVIAAEGDISVETCKGGLHVYPLTPTTEGRAARARLVRSVVE